MTKKNNRVTAVIDTPEKESPEKPHVSRHGELAAAQARDEQLETRLRADLKSTSDRILVRAGRIAELERVIKESSDG